MLVGLRDWGCVVWDQSIRACLLTLHRKSKEASSILRDFLIISPLDSYRVGLVGTEGRHRRMLRWERGPSFIIAGAPLFLTALFLSTSSTTWLSEKNERASPVEQGHCLRTPPKNN